MSGSTFCSLEYAILSLNWVLKILNRFKSIWSVNTGRFVSVIAEVHFIFLLLLWSFE